MSDTPTITAKGVISLQTIAMPADTNWNGDIFGGWLMAQMDLAGAVAARKRAHGRITTVAVESMIFLHPVKIGDVLSCYTNIERVGNTSMKIRIEVWETADPCRPIVKLTEGVYTYVAIDEDGKPRSVPAEACPT
ncbi:MAG: acyl-CoA thioesterase [Moraxellaceae bacterium]|jgi:acyl-CoA thioesterase YciA|nr:acyl-CoA thioesterase [Moraxellaceae bacterium]MBP8851841.1 acyl-CoA thioesterase [Moraxellaceae bacterium]MBP9046284.1 acyl-CoA thioesterase [Moraxellaceae bacterium]MBP9730897.1 acyl-CoA thioesterase [Moraxellaceae bacterium]